MTRILIAGLALAALAGTATVGMTPGAEAGMRNGTSCERLFGNRHRTNCADERIRRLRPPSTVPQPQRNQGRQFNFVSDPNLSHSRADPGGNGGGGGGQR